MGKKRKNEGRRENEETKKKPNVHVLAHVLTRLELSDVVQIPPRLCLSSKGAEKGER
jgi:hypothetical protein